MLALRVSKIVSSTLGRASTKQAARQLAKSSKSSFHSRASLKSSHCLSMAQKYCKWTPSPFLMVLAAAAPIAVVQATTDDEQKKNWVIEPRTGLSQPPVVFGDQTLVGTAARSVTLFGFLTYSFALYRVDKKWSGETDPQKVLENFIKDPAGSTMRITTYRSIDCTHFCGSIGAGIIPRIKKQLESAGVDSDTATKQAEELSKQFRQCFRSKDLPVNTPVDFVISSSPKQENRMSIYINGTEEGQIAGNLFTNAFVDMFFGPDPKSKEIHAGVLDYLNKSATTNKV